MRDYLSAPQSGNHRTRHQDCPRTEDLQARLELTWWRNPNYSDGRYARYRSRIEHRVERWRPIAIDVVLALSPLTLIGIDPVRVLELKRSIINGDPSAGWAIEDPCSRVRRTDHRTSVYIPRRAFAQARAWLRTVREAARLVGLRVTRGGFLKARGGRALANFPSPTAPAPKKVSHPYPDVGRDKDLDPKLLAEKERLMRVIERIGAKLFGERPPDAM